MVPTTPLGSYTIRCGIAEKFKILICISLLNKRYYCLIPRSIAYFSQFSAIPHLTTFGWSISRKTTPLVLYTVPFDIWLIYFAKSYAACVYTVPFDISPIYFAKNYFACTLHCSIRHLGLCCTVRHFNVLFQYRELTHFLFAWTISFCSMLQTRAELFAFGLVQSTISTST